MGLCTGFVYGTISWVMHDIDHALPRKSFLIGVWPQPSFKLLHANVYTNRQRHSKKCDHRNIYRWVILKNV